MSPRTFARRFRETTGTSPYRWMLLQRVLFAQRLLETTDLPSKWSHEMRHGSSGQSPRALPAGGRYVSDGLPRTFCHIRT